MEFTKEGLIVKALLERPLRYTDLRAATGLSDAWLSKKLKELLSLGVIALRSDKYLVISNRLQEALAEEKPFLARAIAYELSQSPDVLAVVLFGSLARNSSGSGADIDLLVVTKASRLDPIALSVGVLRRFGVAVDIVNITFKELLSWFLEMPPLLFGILGGYEVLFDRGWFVELFNMLEESVRKEWVCLKEEMLWVRKESLQSISEQPRST